MKKLLIILFVGLFFSARLSAQHTGFTVTTEGYILNLDGALIFQPCEDDSLSVLNSLDHRSFILGNIPSHDGIWEALSEVGDTLTMKVYDRFSKGQYRAICKYFYGRVTLELGLFDTIQWHKPEFVYPPGYELSYNGVKYSCFWYSIENRILKVIPKRKGYLDGIYDYYKRNDYVVPEWLEDIYNPNREKSIEKLDYIELMKEEEKRKEQKKER